MSRILLTGSRGQVGAELVSVLSSLGSVVGCDRRALDLADPDAIVSMVREVAPDVIVNAAAYTAVDAAEADPESAMAVNGRAPGILAEEAAKLNALLVHFSTDYVFDGTKRGPYEEDDPPNPLNVYGRTKLAGERAIQASGAAYVLLRTSWVYGAKGKNFLLTILRLADERDELRVVHDQVGAPTWCRDIAQATGAILESLKDSGHALSKSSGDTVSVRETFHLSAEGSTTWHDFAAAILAARPSLCRKPRLVAISSSEYRTAAARPPNSLLSHDKLRRRFGIEMAHWSTSMHACLNAMTGACT